MGSRSRRRTPTQERAQATIAAILTATAQLLVDDGYARLSTNRIAKRAGVSVGTLYQYFANKEEVVEALVEQVATRQIEAFAADLAHLQQLEAGLEAGARALLDGLTSMQRIEPALSGVLLREAPKGGAQDLQQAWLRRARELLGASMWPRREQFREGDLEVMLYVLVTAVFAVLQDALAYRPELFASGHLEQELSVLVIRFLRPES